MQDRVKICLVVEGCYPYTVGGVSSWVQMLIEQTDYADFIIATIVSDRSKSGCFALEVPDNVISVHEMFLEDNDYTTDKRKNKTKLSEREYGAIRSLLIGENVDWETVFAYFSDGCVSVNDLLMGPDFLRMTREYYSMKYQNVTFSDFLWSLRSIYLPLFLVLKNKVPYADLYHCVATGYAGVWGSGAKLLHNSPLLISEHGIYTREREEELIKASWVKGIYKDIWINQFYKMSRCAYCRADLVTSLFENARQLQLELGCPQSVTQVTPNGIDTDRFADIPRKAEDDEYINVGAILRIAPIKDVKTMLCAYYYAKQRVPELKLWIMGKIDLEDEYTAQCMELVEDMQIRDVVFTGVVDVTQYVGRMDMLLLTSVSEGQPMCILEGFCAGVPCIATNVGNCKGLIYGEGDEFGEAGIVTAVMDVAGIADGVVKLAQSCTLREQMGAAGLRRVRARYAREMLRDTYDDIYERLLTAGGRWEKIDSQYHRCAEKSEGRAE